MKYSLLCFCLGFIWREFDFVIIFLKNRHRVLVVIFVCYLSFIIVFSSSPINNKFHRSSSVELFDSIFGLLNDIDGFERFLSLYHLVAN